MLHLLCFFSIHHLLYSLSNSYFILMLLVSCMLYVFMLCCVFLLSFVPLPRKLVLSWPDVFSFRVCCCYRSLSSYPQRK